MNPFDFAASLLTGDWRLRRQMVEEEMKFRALTQPKREMMVANHLARSQLYAGAEPGVNRPMANQLSTPEDYKQAYERIVLIRAARQMEEDYGFFDGLLEDFELFVIGSEPRYIPVTGNAEADQVIRDFLEWQFDQADYSARLDFVKIAQLMVRTMKRDGECGLTPVDVGDSIKLKYFSGDCIGNPLVGSNIGPFNYNGIIVDEETEAPTIYRLFRRLPKLNAYVPDVDIPADHFWHYYDPFRLQQYHGVSCFKNAIRDAFDIDQILEFAKMNIKFRSSQLPVIHTETGRPRGAGFGYFGVVGAQPGSPVTPTGEPRPLNIQVEGVTSTYLKTDEAVVDFPHDFPNAQLQTSIEEFRRQCCKGAKIPYEFTYRAETGGVVLRFWADKAMRQFNKDKRWAKRTFLNPFKNRSIEKGIETGNLDLRRFGNLVNDPARFKGYWQLGDTVSVDYSREVEADLKLIDGGLMSPQEYAAFNARDQSQIDAEIEAHTEKLFERAQRVAKKTGVDLALVLPYMVKKFPNPGAGLAAAGASGGVEPNPDDPVK